MLLISNATAYSRVSADINASYSSSGVLKKKKKEEKRNDKHCKVTRPTQLCCTLHIAHCMNLLGMATDLSLGQLI
jgi:hypothetical protein